MAQKRWRKKLHLVKRKNPNKPGKVGRFEQHEQQIDAKTTDGQPRAVEKIYITRQLLSKYLDFNLIFSPFCTLSSLS